MSYFPFFVDLSQRRGLIVGGGIVALRKIQKLLPYGPALTVVAPAINERIQSIPGLTLHIRAFETEDLEPCDFVIAATDDHVLNHQISKLCQAKRRPVNVVDCKEECSFLFPALVKRGEVSIGISTGGTGPTAAVYLKEQIAERLPERLEEIMGFFEMVRQRAKEEVPDEICRRQLLAGVFADCMERGVPLTEKDLEERLRTAAEENGGKA